jgi:hypothetical protein
MEELRDCIELIRMCLVHCCYDGVGTRYMSGTKPNLYAEGHNFIFMNPPSWTNSRHQLILRTRSRWSKQEKVHFTVLADLHVGKRSVNYILVLHKSPIIETILHTPDVHALSPIHAPFQNFHPAELVSTRISSLLKSRRCGFSRLAIVNYKKCLLHQLEQVQLYERYLEKRLIFFGDVQFFQGFENLSWRVV